MPADALPVPQAVAGPRLASPLSFCKVTFGPYTDASGESAFVGMVGYIKPTRQVRVGGVVIVNKHIDVVIGADGRASVELAHTGQGDEDFRYEIFWDAVRVGDPTPGYEPFELPVSVGDTVSFDALQTNGLTSR